MRPRGQRILWWRVGFVFSDRPLPRAAADRHGHVGEEPAACGLFLLLHGKARACRPRTHLSSTRRRRRPGMTRRRWCRPPLLVPGRHGAPRPCPYLARDMAWRRQEADKFAGEAPSPPPPLPPPIFPSFASPSPPFQLQPPAPSFASPSPPFRLQPSAPRLARRIHGGADWLHQSQRRMSSSSATLGTFPSTDLQHESATAVSSVLLLCDWSDDNPCEVCI
jgi:hypothetical protein